MKRELKVIITSVEVNPSIGYTACPNEEGTESLQIFEGHEEIVRYTACPNEEGTERYKDRP
mgnify:CR=1 FL=1